MPTWLIVILFIFWLAVTFNVMLGSFVIWQHNSVMGESLGYVQRNSWGNFMLAFWIGYTVSAIIYFFS